MKWGNEKKFKSQNSKVKIKGKIPAGFLEFVFDRGIKKYMGAISLKESVMPLDIFIIE